MSVNQPDELEQKVLELEQRYGISSAGSSLLDLFLRGIVLEQPELITKLQQFLAKPELQKEALERQIQKCWAVSAPLVLKPPVQIELSFQDQSAKTVFDELKGCLSRIHPSCALATEHPDHPTHCVHVVAVSSCRLEFGHELSKNKMEEILTRHKEVFVLTLHLGMRAPPIQFTSPYGDRIKIGQVVYTDRRAPLLELVDDAEGAPLSVCKNKLAAFLQSGYRNGGEVNESKANVLVDVPPNSKEGKRGKKSWFSFGSSKPDSSSSSSSSFPQSPVSPDLEPETLSTPQTKKKKRVTFRVFSITKNNT